MLPLFTSDQMRALDRRASAEFGIPGLVLMENAANRLLDHIIAEFGDPAELSIAVFCGPGNNGGDGLALARLLFLRGADVEVWLLARPDVLTGDARTNYETCVRLEVPVFTPEQAGDLELAGYDLLVDALFGTGKLRPLNGEIATVVEMMNESELPILAVDVPSGVDASTGEIGEPAVQATTTLTFQCGKPGLFLAPGRAQAGEVVIAPISLPVSFEDMQQAAWFLPEAPDAAALFGPRDPDSHKGAYGKLLLLAGSAGMSGAARLAAQAALRSGVGLLKVGVPVSTRAEVAQQPEAMVVGLAETAAGRLSVQAWPAVKELLDWADAVALGPGWGTDRETGELLAKILSTKKPLVIDADGLNLLAAHDLLGRIPSGCVLTPHPGEFSRLTGTDYEHVHERLIAARELAANLGAVVHVKSSTSVTMSPDGRAYVNSTGNAGLATGGSGDLLTGMIGALLARGIPAVPAAWGAAYVHGYAADLAVKTLGEASLLPSDVAQCLPQAIQSLISAE